MIHKSNMPNSYKWMVGTRCFTYNHAPYIVETMDGFARQETTFPFVSVIVDDASTDGEPEVIRHYIKEHFNDPYRTEETEYASIICTHHKTNPNCEFVVLLLKYNHYSIKKSKMDYLSEWLGNVKYYAICEGDDYWTNAAKLQTQVDFLEEHLECSLCFHAAMILHQDGNVTDYRPEPQKKIYTPEDIVDKSGAFMATNSMLYRSQYLLSETKPDFWKHSLIGDLPLMLFLITKGNFGYLDKFMSVYRYMAKGSWSERDKEASVGELINRLHHNVLMYKEYNDYTGGKYKSIINKRIIKNKKIFYVRIVKTFFCSISKFWK